MRRLLFLVAVLALTWVSWVFLSRSLATARWFRAHNPAPDNSEFDRIYGGTDLKILQFYAREASVVEGGHTVICYGVLNAVSVRIDPPLDNVSPALNRCLEAAPGRQTLYTLTTQAADGRAVSQSLLLGVHPDPETLPRITAFRVDKRERDYAGKWIFSLSYAIENPGEVSIDPPAFPPLHRSPFGNFYVAPPRTTTYTLTVTGLHGHNAQRQLTVEVPPL